MNLSSVCRLISSIIYLYSFSNTYSQNEPQAVRFSDSLNDVTIKSTSAITIDSDLTLEEAINGQQIPESTKENLEIVTVQYYGFDNSLHQGQILVHKEIVKDITEIFNFIRDSRFPIEKVVPICSYKWSDEESMKDNNTSSFNYRFISGSRIHSMHASGLAIDINPLQNPYIKNHIVLPEGAVYDSTKPGTLKASSQLVKEFKKRGWSWGGDWKNLNDYQHFEKKLK